jgi:hypothetical protein
MRLAKKSISPFPLYFKVMMEIREKHSGVSKIRHDRQPERLLPKKDLGRRRDEPLRLSLSGQDSPLLPREEKV